MNVIITRIESMYNVKIDNHHFLRVRSVFGTVVVTRVELPITIDACLHRKSARYKNI